MTTTSFSGTTTTVALAVLGLTLASCTGNSTSSALDANRQMLAGCPSAPLASQAAIDVSGTVRADALPAPYAAAVQDLARRTAICGGHLSVVAFSASSAATVGLYDGNLQMPGSTENARLRRVPQAVEEVMQSVGEGYATKVSGLTAGGTDVVAQYRLVGEYAHQLGGNRQLELLLLTDGFQSAGAIIGDRPLSNADAASLADRFDLPQLPGATITVAGIGKTNDPQPASTEVVDGLKAFYAAICERTGAATCVTVTDYIAAGG